VTTTLEKIQSYGRLKKGWHFGEGVSIQRGTLVAGRSALTSLTNNGFDQTDAFPGLAGEIRVTGYRGSYYFELTVVPGPEFEFTVEKDGKITFREEKICLARMKKLVKTYANGI